MRASLDLDRGSIDLDLDRGGNVATGAVPGGPRSEQRFKLAGPKTGLPQCTTACTPPDVNQTFGILVFSCCLALVCTLAPGLFNQLHCKQTRALEVTFVDTCHRASRFPRHVCNMNYEQTPRTCSRRMFSERRVPGTARRQLPDRVAVKASKHRSHQSTRLKVAVDVDEGAVLLGSESLSSCRSSQLSSTSALFPCH